MKDSDVQLHGGVFETSMECKECGSFYEGRVNADSEKEAVLETIREAEGDGWTDGPLCPECSKKEEGDEDEE